MFNCAWLDSFIHDPVHVEEPMGKRILMVFYQPSPVHFWRACADSRLRFLFLAVRNGSQCDDMLFRKFEMCAFWDAFQLHIVLWSDYLRYYRLSAQSGRFILRLLLISSPSNLCSAISTIALNAL